MKGDVLAIDLEARGPGPLRHGIVSIGVCVGSSTEEKVLGKRRFDLLPLPGQFMDDRTKTEFWDKHPGLFDSLSKDAQDPLKQIEAFREYMDSFSGEPFILSDNPAFDFGMINVYLDMAKLPTLSFDATGRRYRNLHDIDSYGRGVLKRGFDEPWLSNIDLLRTLRIKGLDIASHDHFPENDAEFLYRLHFKTLKALGK